MPLEQTARLSRPKQTSSVEFPKGDEDVNQQTERLGDTEPETSIHPFTVTPFPQVPSKN